MGEEFKPSLYALEGFGGKVKADYNEFTQYLTLVLADGGKMASFNGIVKDQVEVDNVVKSLLAVIVPIETAELEEPKVEKKSKK